MPSRAALRAGAVAALPFTFAAFALGVSFGAVAVDGGFPIAAAIVMSVICNAGSAQFAALTIITGGGSIGAAVTAGTLMNGRFLPMGLALGPSLPGRALWRAVQGQATVDASWVLAAQEGGTYDRFRLFGATAIQYVGFVSGTTLGALAAGSAGDLDRFGLDAILPAFFLTLLAAELRTRVGRGVAAVAALTALLLAPIAPAGVPVLAAALIALVGLRTPAAPPTPAVPAAS